ncbi:MAG: hypothetical protein WC742_11800 [Gallionellaceae bacterium]|jgi:DNA-binding beta-propeller fold protein YncE
MKIFLSIILLFLSCISFNAIAQDSASSTKAIFSKQIFLPEGVQKFLGNSPERLYFSQANGAIVVTDFAGKSVQTLQVKQDKENLLSNPLAVVQGREMLYVLDGDRKQVLMFTRDGKYTGSFAAKESRFFRLSSEEHELKQPVGLAYFEGVVYVLDRDSNKILLFGDNGVFLNVLALQPSLDLKVAKTQRDSYTLKKPLDLRIDITGRLYIWDAEDSLIKVYSQDGNFISATAIEGELSALAVAKDGLYIAKNNEPLVQKFDFNNTTQFKIGSKENGGEPLKNISGLAVGKDRQIALLDIEKSMMNIYVVDMGIPLEAIPRSGGRVFAQSAGTLPFEVLKLAWNGKDTIYAIDPGQQQILLIKNGKPEGNIRLKNFNPIALAVDADNALWVLDKKSGIHKLDESGKVLFSFANGETGDAELDTPADLAISVSGKLYVADKGNASVQVFSREGKFLSEISGLDEPDALAVDKNDTLFVLEKGKDVVSIYSAQGVLVGKVGGTKEPGVGRLLKPVALMTSLDEVFVVDGNHIKVYATQGEFKRLFGARGSQEGELNEPLALARKDDISLLVAERGNKRIQSFITQFKPPAPQNFRAQGGAHNISLNWNLSALPYVKQYQLYRSKDERLGFIKVATVSGNQFVDRGLEVNGKYFYRVAAVTSSDFEGTSSALVSAVSQRYTPPALSAVEVQSTPWKIKLSWRPIESEFVSSYYVYEKKDSIFSKLAEVIAPEFEKNLLQPNTKYTYYIAAHSSDDTEAEKFAVETSTQPFDKEPLSIGMQITPEIESEHFSEYEQDGLGKVLLTNNTDMEMQGVTLSYFLNGFMEKSQEIRLEKLSPGQPVEVIMKIVFNSKMHNVTEDIVAQFTLEANYLYIDKRQSSLKNLPLIIKKKIEIAPLEQVEQPNPPVEQLEKSNLPVN